jgi:hypothetical protein
MHPEFSSSCQKFQRKFTFFFRGWVKILKNKFAIHVCSPAVQQVFLLSLAALPNVLPQTYVISVEAG